MGLVDRMEPGNNTVSGSLEGESVLAVIETGPVEMFVFVSVHPCVVVVVLLFVFGRMKKMDSQNVAWSF